MPTLVRNFTIYQYPLEKGSSPRPGTCDNSKVQLSLQHDQEAPCGQALSDS